MLDFVYSNIVDVNSYNELKDAISQGKWARGPLHLNNKPLQASVRAVTSGTLWALKREDFRGILTSEFSNLSSLKLLRSVDLLSRLTILQLSHIAESLSEVSFSEGQIIADRDEAFLGLYIIKKGQPGNDSFDEREAFSCCLLVMYLVTTCSSKWSSMSTAIQHFDAIRKR
ncbi:hypothetical protein HYC85_018430 [Camellia sinensis]|uniref:Cyclic nucleotide-binding domain-containing protein n=1 Tax=Camellia sinensis TaxID=4442 RepID=A0A7J7GU99_CAMSI|nr:hypothetical protein HYC85_018430 [Camellia sinensis]